jgi:PAS domain S-box-containing protein
MKLLHVEDNRQDAELVAHALHAEWADVDISVVDNRAAYVAALDHGGFDVILCDFKLPGFDGHEALALARQRRPEIPLMFVSVGMDEETVAAVVRAGAVDYLVKDRLARLPSSIRQALKRREDERQRAEAEARLREQAELLDKVKDGIVALTPGHRIEYWNRGAERMFGWTREEVVGRAVGEMFGPDVESAFVRMEQQLAQRDEWESELSFSDRSMRRLLCEVRVTTVKDAGGLTASRLALFTDVTERKLLEAQLHRAHRLESLGMLAAGIAHDLNNALAPMLMAGGLLRTRVSDPADIRLVELLEQSAHRGAALVKQIVSFAGARSRERVLIQPKHLVREIAQLVRDTFPKLIQVSVEIAEPLWAVEGNPTQLHQVLLNLCINARDAMPSGGVLRLRARNEMVTQQSARANPGGAPGPFVVIEVADTGTGIPPEVLRRMWDPFFTTKNEGEGTGLGLSTVRGIVGDHGGFIAVESELGHGATFHVYLPAAPATVVDGGDGARSSVSRPGGRGELVLVVDDQESVRESIALVLSKNGYRPLTTTDGVEALSKYADRIGQLSIVITDLDMPGLNGASFAQAVVRLNPTLRVLFISGTAEAAGARKLAPGDSAAFLEKPFTLDALLAKVNGLLHHDAIT